MYQVLDGCLIEVTTTGELLVGWPKGAHGRLVRVKVPIVFYKYFGTLITWCLIEGGH